MPMDCNESNNQTISSCCFSLSPTASTVGQSILATVAIHAPRKAISARVGTMNKDKRQKTTMLRNLTIFYMEYLGILIWFQDVGKVLSIRVGNKNLPELVPLYHLHNSFYPFAVQPIEDIV